ncbi:DNA-binding protein [Micromonospora sp. NPDC094482]|uniref:DNA-binding protein n=1 Tax=unclassified Micromonospora TaxID=2617518 RepID=UPI00332F3382
MSSQPSAGQPDPQLYTPAEAGARLRVPESRLRRRAGRRQIPCTFLGKHLRFSAAGLAAIIAASAEAATGRRAARTAGMTVRRA